MSARALLVCGLFLVFTLAVSAQSPWARSRAGFFAQAAWQFIPSYTQLYGPAGSDIELPRAVRENTFQFYGEYGWTRRTTAVLSLPFSFQERGSLNPNVLFPVTPGLRGRLAGLGNVQLALRHQFTRRSLAFSGTFRVSLPAKGYRAETGLRTGLDAFTLAPLLSTGMGFRRAYWFAYAGYGWRSDRYSAFIQSGAEAGYHLGRCWLIGVADWNVSLNNGARTLPAQPVLTGLYVNDQQWLSIGLKTLVTLHRFWGLSASATGAAWGRYVPEKPAFSLGVYFKWD